MKTLWIPAILLGLACGLFLASLVYAADRLPERVATHFDFRGRPNGWMSRPGDLLLIAALGFGVPLLLVGSCVAWRYLPASLVNLPHREYWLAPERRGQTAAYLVRHSLWLACLAVLFITCIHLLVVFANCQPVPQLSIPWFLVSLGCFLAGVGGWIFSLYRRFGAVATFAGA